MRERKCGTCRKPFRPKKWRRFTCAECKRKQVSSTEARMQAALSPDREVNRAKAENAGGL